MSTQRRHYCPARLRVLAALVGLLCVGSALAHANSKSLVLTDFWIRALPPGQTVTAAYGTVTNTSPTAITLVGASTGAAGSAELHNTVQRDGRASMQRVTSLVINPGETVNLSPGGLHLMILGLEQMPAEGSTLELCLDSDQQSSCTMATVRRESPELQHQHHHH